MKEEKSILQKIAAAERITTHKSRHSFVSSNINDDFIKTEYYFDKSIHHFYATVIFGKKAMGPPGHVHGGAIAAVLDEALGAAAWMNGLYSMTARLQIDYMAALPIDTPVFVEAWVEKQEGKKVTLNGCLKNTDGKVFSKTSSLFIKQNREKFEQMGDMPDDLFIFDSKP